VRQDVSGLDATVTVGGAARQHSRDDEPFALFGKHQADAHLLQP
jgi:hypothetical protein